MPTDTNPHRILVVDDYDLNRDLLRFRLEGMGCEVHECANGELALAMLNASNFDLVLLDVVMPVMDGKQTLQAIKENEKLKNIPVIMVSAVNEIETVAHCLNQGADDFLTKPFNPVFLKTRVRSCLERKRLQDQYDESTDAAGADSANDSSASETEPAIPEAASTTATNDGEVAARSALLLQLAKLIETRSSKKPGRLERIRDYAITIAKQLARSEKYADNIDQQFLDDLYEAAPLHDIGKASTPETILQKPGKLDAHERALMQAHTNAGADTLRIALQEQPDSSFITMAVDVAQNHHERWDGTGYPNAIQGEAIPLAARIVSLADTYDALTTRSSYKEMTNQSELINIISAESAKQLDPDVVEAFLAKEQEFSRIQITKHDPITRH